MVKVSKKNDQRRLMHERLKVELEVKLDQEMDKVDKDIKSLVDKVENKEKELAIMKRAPNIQPSLQPILGQEVHLEDLKVNKNERF